MTIWKFPFAVQDVVELIMPRGARILHVNVQRNEPTLWALVDASAPKVVRTLNLYGTGHALPMDPGTYVGTFMLYEGGLVFHVFDEEQAGAS